MQVIPYGGRILIKIDVKNPNDDFIMMADSKKPTDLTTGVVVTAPPAFADSMPAIGDRVAFIEANGATVDIDGEPHIVIKEEHIIYGIKE